MTLSEVTAQMDSLWASAELRRDAGEPVIRCIPLAYSMSPGDGEITARAWLTDPEAERLHELQLMIRRLQQTEAAERLSAKIRARKP